MENYKLYTSRTADDIGGLWEIYSHTVRAQRADYLTHTYKVQCWMGQTIRNTTSHTTLEEARTAAIAWLDYRDGPPQPARFTDGTLVSDFWKAQRR